MRTILAAALALLLVSASASAQTKAFVLLSTPCQLISCDPTYLLEVDIESRRILGLTHIANGPYPADRSGLTGDGRYLVWAGEKSALSPTFLSVFDNVAHTTIASVLLEPEPVPRLIVHPSEPRVFLLQGANVVVIEADRQQTFPAICPTRPPDSLGLSGDGARLFAFCLTDVFPLQRGETRVLDSETGGLIATVANTSAPLATNAAGTELYAVDYTSGYPGILKRYDIATGAVLAQRAFQAGRNPGPIAIHPRSGRLYVTTMTGPDPGDDGNLLVYDGTTLDLLTEVATPGPARVSFANGIPLAIVYLSMRDAVTGRLWARLMLFHTDNLASLTSVDLPAGAFPVGVLIGQSPPRPEALSATVSGNQVALRWSPGSGVTPATEYNLEAGLVSGQTVLSTTVPVTTTTVTVPNVPAGVYYVRVRAGNFAARSAASEEVQVTVP